MMRHFKILIWVMAIITIFVGFFAGREYDSFFWHRIPSMEAISGFLGTFILILLSRVLAWIAFKKEDSYD